MLTGGRTSRTCICRCQRLHPMPECAAPHTQLTQSHQHLNPQQTLATGWVDISDLGSCETCAPAIVMAAPQPPSPAATSTNQPAHPSSIPPPAVLHTPRVSASITSMLHHPPAATLPLHLLQSLSLSSLQHPPAPARARSSSSSFPHSVRVSGVASALRRSPAQ